MGRDLQKKKRRSSRPTIRQSNRPRRALNPLGNSLIARNWNKKETLSQNYRRLGLAPLLRPATGGTERFLGSPNDTPAISVAPPDVSEAQLERGPDGRVVRIVVPPQSQQPPQISLPLPQSSSTAAEIVAALEEEAARARAGPRPRTVSEREREWLRLLVGRHGNNTAAMARDRKLNQMQQTEADIARRLRVLATQG